MEWLGNLFKAFIIGSVVGFNLGCFDFKGRVCNKYVLKIFNIFIIKKLIICFFVSFGIVLKFKLV